MLVVRQRLADFLRKEAVLCAAVLLAAVSACFVRPSRAYFDYIDWDTLALLFSLMAVMKGFQSAGVFSFLAGKLLKKANTSRKIMLVLVFLPFFLSMLVTNDVSLITFVPFGLIVLRSAKLERLAVPLAVLQTLAANLGSMLTPMGNPQNLYLYNFSGMSFGGLVLLMLQLKDLRKLFIIVCTAPMGIIGVVIGLLLFNSSMGFLAQLGILSLTGIIIRNSVVLIDQIDLHLAAGMNPYEAVLESAIVRFRPIMLAALTTVLGLVPMFTNPFWESMAVAIACGLTGATMLTLVVLPVIYSIMFKITKA